MKTTIDMAKEAGLLTWLKPPEDVIERFKAFEALVRADEREKLIEQIDWTALIRKKALVTWGDASYLGDCVVEAIRARGNR